jgi:hypothetical protein
MLQLLAQDFALDANVAAPVYACGDARPESQGEEKQGHADADRIDGSSRRAGSAKACIREHDAANEREHRRQESL